MMMYSHHFKLLQKCNIILSLNNVIIITTNKPFSKWGELFGDNMIANAILDRLLHHSHVINITGNSYRTKDIIEIKNEENS